MRRERAFCGRMPRLRKTEQNVARIVANAMRRFRGEPLTPDGEVERVAKFTLECQRDVGRRLRVPEPSFAKSVFGGRGFDSEFRQAAAPDQHPVFLAQDGEIAECETLIALESGLQPSGRSLGRARLASGPKVPRDFGECVNAGEERQIVRRDSPQHQASGLQPVCAACQGHFVGISHHPVRGRYQMQRCLAPQCTPDIGDRTPQSRRPGPRNRRRRIVR